MKRVAIVAAILALTSTASARPPASWSWNSTGRGGGSWHGFSPTWIGSIKSDWNADKGVTIATGASAWADQGPAADNWAQATGGNQPSVTTLAALGGHHVLTFNGSTSFMTLASAQLSSTPQAIVAVAYPTTVSGTQTVVTMSYARMLEGITGKFACYAGQSSNGVMASALSVNTPYDLICSWTGNAIVTGYINGTSGSDTNNGPGVSASPNTLAANTNGTNQFGAFQLARLLTFTAALSADAVVRLRAYVTNLYGFGG